MDVLGDWLPTYVSTTSANTCGFKLKQTKRLESSHCFQSSQLMRGNK